MYGYYEGGVLHIKLNYQSEMLEAGLNMKWLPCSECGRMMKVSLVTVDITCSECVKMLHAGGMHCNCSRCRKLTHCWEVPMMGYSEWLCRACGAAAIRSNESVC